MREREELFFNPREPIFDPNENALGYATVEAQYEYEYGDHVGNNLLLSGTDEANKWLDTSTEAWIIISLPEE